MKTTELNTQITSGVSVATGLFRGYKVEDTDYGVRETYDVLIGRHVVSFTKFAPKGVKLADVKQPEWVKAPGIVICAVVNVSFRIEGKYMRVEWDSIAPVER